MKGTLCRAGISLLFSLSLGAAQVPPAPADLLGFAPGSDRQLADWTQILGYLDQLARDSDRVLLQELGRTTGGERFVMLIISHPENLARLDYYQNLQRRLADPRLSGESPAELLEEGRTILLATCAIHSSEVASAQMSLQFAYEMARDQGAETGEILRNVIFLLVPSLNPDGLNLVNHWYRETVDTPAEGTLPPLLYHPYAGHDNNRDWFMFTQKETRLAVTRIHNVWHPQIVLDLHEMGAHGPRMFVPPYAEPIDPNVDPLLQAQIVRLGGGLLTGLIGAGKRGIVTRAIYDAYTPARAYQHYHGGVRILIEAARARLATPLYLDRSELVSGSDYDVHRPSWNFPVPWEGGRWGLPEIVDHQKIALRAALLDAARYRRSWLENFQRVGRRALEETRPAAFLLPADQRNPESLADLLEVLRIGRVEVQTAGRAFQAPGARLVSPPFGRSDREHFPAGSHLIRLDQPYGAFAKTLLEMREYPNTVMNPEGPLRRPYDVTGHSLGIQLEVEVYSVEGLPRAEPGPEGEGPRTESRVEGSGSFALFSHSNNAFARLANRLLKQGHPVYWAPNGFRAEGRGWPAGTLMTRWEADAAGLEQLLGDLPLRLGRVQKQPLVAWQKIRLPAIGLYRSHSPAKDEGWTRWVLEDYGFPYRSLGDRDIRGSDLTPLDTIVIPHQDPGRIEVGLTDPYPEPYQGGLGEEGVERLHRYAQEGGTLIFLGAATRLPLARWDLGAQAATRGLHSGELFVPGALLRVEVNNRHPIGYGMAGEAAVMYYGGEAFELTRGMGPVTYSDRDLLLSGWLEGESQLAGKTALAELPLGKGRVILIGFRTQFRGQTRGTYKLLFNSLYYAASRR